MGLGLSLYLCYQSLAKRTRKLPPCHWFYTLVDYSELSHLPQTWCDIQTVCIMSVYATKQLKTLTFPLALDVTSQEDERGGITRPFKMKEYSTALWPLNHMLFFSVDSIPLRLTEREQKERIDLFLPLYILVYIDHVELLCCYGNE